MRIVMQKLFFLRGRRSLPIFDDRMQFHEAHPWNPLFVLRHVPNRFVPIRFDLKTFFRGQIQKREHVTARYGRYERFFRIHIRRIGMRNRNDQRGRGRRNGKTSVE
jgi:hypothetical protein